jgi:hypothetical protein
MPGHSEVPLDGSHTVWSHTDLPHPALLLRTRRERPSGSRAEKRDELAPFHAEHGDFLPCRLASPPGLTLGLPHAQPAAERPASPWGKSELF